MQTTLSVILCVILSAILWVILSVILRRGRILFVSSSFLAWHVRNQCPSQMQSSVNDNNETQGLIEVPRNALGERLTKNSLNQFLYQSNEWRSSKICFMKTSSCIFLVFFLSFNYASSCFSQDLELFSVFFPDFHVIHWFLFFHILRQDIVFVQVLSCSTVFVFFFCLFLVSLSCLFLPSPGSLVFSRSIPVLYAGDLFLSHQLKHRIKKTREEERRKSPEAKIMLPFPPSSSSLFPTTMLLLSQRIPCESRVVLGLTRLAWKLYVNHRECLQGGNEKKERRKMLAKTWDERPEKKEGRAKGRDISSVTSKFKWLSS